MDYHYCPICGAELIQKEIIDEGKIPYCINCNKLYFSFTKQCVLVGIINEKNQIALTKQKHIAPDHWILISGYIKQGETIEETVIREVKEETGQEVEKLKYIRSYYIRDLDMLMLGFITFVKQQPFTISNEIDEISWFNFDDALQAILKDSVAEQLLKDIYKCNY
jgi:NAD+ diphosphatase